MSDEESCLEVLGHDGLGIKQAEQDPNDAQERREILSKLDDLQKRTPIRVSPGLYSAPIRELRDLLLEAESMCKMMELEKLIVKVFQKNIH